MFHRYVPTPSAIKKSVRLLKYVTAVYLLTIIFWHPVPILIFSFQFCMFCLFCVLGYAWQKWENQTYLATKGPCIKLILRNNITLELSLLYMYFVSKDELQLQGNTYGLGQNVIHNPRLLNSNLEKIYERNVLQRFYKVDKVMYRVKQK